MIDGNAEGDAAASLLERRWFASITAVRAMRAECEVLREVMELAEDSWRRSRGQLARLEALRDALGEEMADRDGQEQHAAPLEAQAAISSAA
jgi:hypothetical protein